MKETDWVSELRLLLLARHAVTKYDASIGTAFFRSFPEDG
jgi:hypothetical protein